MTTLREAAQQALEALCCVRDMVAHPDNLAFIDRNVTALKAALAEPVQEPLTIEQIEEAWDQSNFTGRANISFARDIERAHGIGDSNG